MSTLMGGLGSRTMRALLYLHRWNPVSSQLRLLLGHSGMSQRHMVDRGSVDLPVAPRPRLLSDLERWDLSGGGEEPVKDQAERSLQQLPLT